MARDIDRLRGRSEDIVRRHVGSRAAREGARRKVERGARSVLRRLRNAGVTFVILLVLAILGFATGWLGFVSGFLALIAAVIVSLLVLFWPSRGGAGEPPRVVDGGTAVRLDRLAGRTETWLLERCRDLPHQAGPSLDRIVDRLRDLEPALAGVSPDNPTGSEAQRLIGQHLPGLVTTYLDLPPAERRFGSDTGDRLAESLGIVADELDHLCERIGQERRSGFDTERRFLETRYRDSDRLSLDKPG